MAEPITPEPGSAAVRCPSCGHGPWDAGSVRFCPDCGTPLPAVVPAGTNPYLQEHTPVEPAEAGEPDADWLADVTVLRPRPAAPQTDTPEQILDPQPLPAAAAAAQDPGQNPYLTAPRPAATANPEPSPSVPVVVIDSPARTAGKKPIGRGLIIVAAAGVVVLAVITAAAVIVPQLVEPGPGPAPAADAPSAAPVLPGWSGAPTWSWDGPSGNAVVSPNGDEIAVLGTETLTVLDRDGAVQGSQPVSAAATVLSAAVGAGSALVVVDDGSVTIWQDGAAAASVQVPAGADIVSRAGNVLAVAADRSTASVLGPAVFTSYATPRLGAVALGLSRDGGMVWASSRGEALIASAAGTIAMTVPLASPTAGAVASSWLGMAGQVLIVLWTLPDGQSELATHSLTSGAVIAATPVTAKPTLIWSQQLEHAAAGSTVIDTTTGTMSVPDPAFTAAGALGSGFYGATGTRTATLTYQGQNAVVTPATTAPPASPSGLTSAGALVLATSEGVTTYPPAQTTDLPANPTDQ